MKRLIVVDDEPNICESIKFAAEEAGYNCEVFSNPLDALESMKRNLPDLVILDIVMPEVDGLEVCKRLRKLSDTLPIIFLSSKDEEFDRILGLEIGADDYLCKPFSMKELLARVKVSIRRSGFMVHTPDPTEKAVSQNQLLIDKSTYLATYCKQALNLTVTEFRILYSLAEEAGKVKTREQLMNSAFPTDYHVTDRSIDTHIKRIRRKLRAIDAQNDPIETVFGVGYKFKT